ncbi:hypothetical protein QTP88_005189 [Uroleucon formosanum]
MCLVSQTLDSCRTETAKGLDFAELATAGYCFIFNFGFNDVLKSPHELIDGECFSLPRERCYMYLVFTCVCVFMCLSREVWLANIIIQCPCPEYHVTIILQQWIGLDRIALHLRGKSDLPLRKLLFAHGFTILSAIPLKG